MPIALLVAVPDVIAIGTQSLRDAFSARPRCPLVPAELAHDDAQGRRVQRDHAVIPGLDAAKLIAGAELTQALVTRIRAIKSSWAGITNITNTGPRIVHGHGLANVQPTVLGRPVRQLPIKLIQSVLQTIRFGLQSSNHARQILLLLHCKSLVAGLPEPVDNHLALQGLLLNLRLLFVLLLLLFNALLFLFLGVHIPFQFLGLLAQLTALPQQFLFLFLQLCHCLFVASADYLSLLGPFFLALLLLGIGHLLAHL
mmetsp:Transcript_14626/g.26438  ORF Transcript_14626/g.26438 Transcript_14626/m.26438 type:complete len:255 (+) Transcript_14626:343-1107(+)